MNAPAVAQPAQPTIKLIAPIWHTVLFLIALGSLTAWSAYRHGLPQFGEPRRSTSYLVTIVMEWLLAGLAIWGARLGGVSFQELIGERWSRPIQFFRDLGIGIVFLIGSNVVIAALSVVLHVGRNADLTKMLPHSRQEGMLWILVSLSAGICEEITMRGYLQKQFGGLMQNTSAAIFAQGILFGLAHAYQGYKHMITIAVLGCMLGWLARRQQSLKPGMLAHFMQDAIGGFLSGSH